MTVRRKNYQQSCPEVQQEFLIKTRASFCTEISDEKSFKEIHCYSATVEVLFKGLVAERAPRRHRQKDNKKLKIIFNQ